MLISIVIVLIIGGVILFVTPDDSIIPAIYGIFAIVYILFSLYVKKSTKCPNCGRDYAMDDIKKEELSSRKVKQYVQKKWWNPRTEMYEYYEDEGEPAIEVTWLVVPTCKYCGYEKKPKRRSELIK